MRRNERDRPNREAASYRARMALEVSLLSLGVYGGPEMRPIPTVEQVAWATMVVGEMAVVLHHEPRRRFWERVFGRPEADIHADRAWKSYQVAMALAGWIAIREAGAVSVGETTQNEPRTMGQRARRRPNHGTKGDANE